jgi:FPC/CPF motif-containing protein YcgG
MAVLRALDAGKELHKFNMNISALEERFRGLIQASTYPCLGAKAALHSRSYLFQLYDRLAESKSTRRLAADLEQFQYSKLRKESNFATFVAAFRFPSAPDETEFEGLLWSQLAELNQLDASHHRWDPKVSSDPADPFYSFSFAGSALYVVGLHPRSSRLARRFALPTLVFNPHEQFERLRAEGKWERMKETIRNREVALQGDVNPMLGDFGVSSEARQYSGRAVQADWHAPVEEKSPNDAHGKRCPFGQ